MNVNQNNLLFPHSVQNVLEMSSFRDKKSNKKMHFWYSTKIQATPIK